MLSPRQEHLLNTIIAEYTISAKPVSSGQLAELERLDVSPATVRNDMAVLEEAGYLHQPHTSAGRIPTELAWRWFVKRAMPETQVGKKERDHLHAVAHAHRDSEQEMLRKMAKALAEIIGEAVIIAFDKSDTYSTGLANLFQQPEFEDISVLQNLSVVVDHLDEVMSHMYAQVGNDVSVLVGRDNPFSVACGALLARYSMSKRGSGVIAFLGPMRQEYGEHMAIMRYTQSLLENV